MVRDFFHKKLSEKNATLKEVVLEYVIETIKQQLNKEKNVMNLIAYVWVNICGFFVIKELRFIICYRDKNELNLTLH